MVSAYGDMKNIRIAMNNGAFDFVTKPIDFGDLRTTIEKTRKEIDFIKRKLSQGKRLKVLEADLAAGAIIQSALLPKILGRLPNFPDINIFTHYMPAKEVSGDFYDVFPLDNHHIGFLIADVSGKGVPAAAFMLICHTAIRIYSREGDSPSKVLERANNYLSINNAESMFATAFFAILDTETNILTYSFAGHNKPFLIQQETVEELPSQQNIALGILDEYTFTEGQQQLSHGDKLVMFTDGITEPVDEAGNDYGEEKLKILLETHRHQSIIEIGNRIVAEINTFTRGFPQFDDITLVGFEIKKP
jgi:sigma-B regulation protein RsbU (phosphoserine phosphatase)